MKRYKKAIILFFSAVLVVFVFIRPHFAGKPVPTAEIPVLYPPQEDFLTIIAAGDNLYHNVMVRDGEQGDYESAYSEIRSIVKKADIAFINQETLLGGPEFGFTGYPRFNSPQALGRSLAEVGFNVINHANNHTMDKGERAVFATMDFWDAFPDITVLGIHRSAEQRAQPRLLTINNITVGFLSYTYGTNGIPVPGNRPYLVSLINRELMAKEIDSLRPLCDLLVVSMHWGDEYRHHYNRQQESLAAFLAEHSVDLVIGHHPHVLQPVEFIERPDGAFMLCFYSLGNFLSAQLQNPTLLGALAYVRVKKTAGQQGIVFMERGAIRVVTHYERNWTNFKVYPLHAYTEELLARHLKNQIIKELTMDYLCSLASRVLGYKDLRHNPFD